MKIKDPTAILLKHNELSMKIKPDAVPYILIIDKNNKLVKTIKGANIPLLNNYLPTDIKKMSSNEFNIFYKNNSIKAREYISNLIKKN